MNFDLEQAIAICNTIAYQSTPYKSMEITTQLTQLNALTKLIKVDITLPDSFEQESILPDQLRAIIKRRQMKLKLSFEALVVLEAQWDKEFAALEKFLSCT